MQRQFSHSNHLRLRCGSSREWHLPPELESNDEGSFELSKTSVEDEVTRAHLPRIRMIRADQRSTKVTRIDYSCLVGLVKGFIEKKL